MQIQYSPDYPISRGVKSQIWAAYQEARHERALETRNVSGVVVHVYLDNTLLVLNHDQEIAELYAHHRDFGTLYCGTVEDNQVKLTLDNNR